jgi:aspartate/methionine/tyrosine aminotransferase
MTLAPYIRWAKTCRRPRIDLAASGVRAVSTSELVGDERAADLFALSGPNDEGYEPLVRAIAARYGVAPASVATAAGASGANFLAMAALVAPGAEVLVEEPAYDPLLGVPRLLGARVTRFARRFEDGFALDPDAVAAALGPATRLVVISNPHNPSGALAGPDTLREIGRLAERVGARVLVDEVYLEARFEASGSAPWSAAALGEPFVATSSLTKAWGLPGLRVGWVLGSEAVARRVRETRDLVDVIGAFPAEQLALRAFASLDRLSARAAAILGPQWQMTRDALDGCPQLAYVAPGAGTVVFPRLVGTADATAFAERLLRDHETLVVPGRFFGAPAHVRLSFCGDREALAEGLAALVACAAASGAS